MTDRSIIFRGSLLFDKRPQNFLQNSINAARSWFDGEIIVSTWTSQEPYLSKIKGVDKVVLSDDPCAGPIQHMNRQLVSFMRGVEESSGEELLVTRTDMAHYKDIFSFLHRRPLKTSELNLFEEKIVIGNMMTISPESDEEVKHFRPNDWFHCGIRKDIFKLGNIEQTLAEQDTSGLDCTEQAWSLCLLRKYVDGEITLKEFEDYKKYAWHYIINNFDVYDSQSSLMAFNANWPYQPEFLDCYITELQYQKQYRKITLCED